jgi:hypothetical protein
MAIALGSVRFRVAKGLSRIRCTRNRIEPALALSEVVTVTISNERPSADFDTGLVKSTVRLVVAAPPSEHLDVINGWRPNPGRIAPVSGQASNFITNFRFRDALTRGTLWD